MKRADRSHHSDFTVPKPLKIRRTLPLSRQERLILLGIAAIVYLGLISLSLYLIKGL